MRGTVGARAWWLSPSAGALAALPPVVLAIFICAHQLTLHGVLHGVVLNSEAQNLGSSIAITRGALPYSNFALAQPPGMPVLLLPLAWISHAVAPSIVLPLARGLTAIATVVAVFLAGMAARAYGAPAALLAGVFTATYTSGFLSTGGVTLGPWILAFTLIGICLAFKEGELTEGGRLLAAGLFLGFACTIKPWAVIPAVLLLAGTLTMLREARSRLVPAAGGMAIGIVVPCLVFFLAGPSDFIHQVVLAELPGHGTATAGSKLATVLGLGGAAGIPHPAGAALGIGFAVMAVVFLTAVWGFSSSSVYDWFLALTTVGVIAVVFLPGAMSVQYGEFAFPLVAVGVSTTAGRLLGLVASSWSGRRNDSRSSITSAMAVLVLACAVVVAAVAAPADGRFAAQYADHHGVLPRAVVDHAIPPGACAIADNPTYLIDANRFDQGSGTCPVETDPAGLLAIAGTGGTAAATGRWERWMSLSRYLLLADPPARPPLGGALAGYFHDHYATVTVRLDYGVYVRSR